MAREAGLDLVEVAPTARPPVCRIMDYGKWRYQQQKKEDKSARNSRGGRLKQLNIDTVRIGDHDLHDQDQPRPRLPQRRQQGSVHAAFQGPRDGPPGPGPRLVHKIKQELFLVSKVERDAKMEGKRMTLVLQPDHKNPAATEAPQSARRQQPAPATVGGPRPRLR